MEQVQSTAFTTTSTTPTPSIQSLRPTPSPESNTQSLDLESIGIIAGSIAAGILLATICTVVSVAITISCRKPKHQPKLKRDDSLTDNAAYGSIPKDSAVAVYRKGDTYDYPRFGARILKSLRGKKREDRRVAAGGVGERPGNTYTMTVNHQRNIAYSTSISGHEEEHDIRVPTHINPERNLACGTSVSSVSEQNDLDNSTYVNSISGQGKGKNARVLTHINSERNIAYGTSVSSVSEENDPDNSTYVYSQVFGTSVSSSIDEESNGATYVNSQRKISRTTLVSYVSEEVEPCNSGSGYVIDSLGSSNENEDEYSYVRHPYL